MLTPHICTNGGAAKVLLAVPHVTHYEPAARLAPIDGGAACIAMAVAYLTEHKPGADQVSVEGGAPFGSTFSNPRHLAIAARRFGMIVTFVCPLLRRRIERELRSGFPVLAQVKYDLLGTRGDPNQTARNGAQYVLIVGAGPEKVVYHDPDRWLGGDLGAYRVKSWAEFLKALAHSSRAMNCSQDAFGMVFDV